MKIFNIIFFGFLTSILTSTSSEASAARTLMEEGMQLTKKLLVVHSSPNPLKTSFSRKLAKHFVDGLQARFPGYYDVEELDLELNTPPRVTESTIGSVFTCDPKTPEEEAYEAVSSKLVRQLKSSDAIVISTPMQNFTVPVSLKLWIDAVTRAGQTFQFTDHGVEGLVKDRPVMVVAACGGNYFGTEYDHVVPYLKPTLSFIGVEKFFSVEASATALAGAEDSVANARVELDRHLDSFKEATRSSSN